MITCIVIDDDEDSAESLSVSLQQLNVNVIGKGYDGKEAAELFQKLNPDVVFLDMSMPKYDGFYAIEQIKKQNPNSKIIAITASVDEDMHKRLVQMKIPVIDKPYYTENLVELAKNLVQI